jgi:Zn-finger nucleic acid-binding protein
MNMQCPNDNTTLVMTERSGIEIDYCPQCRGVWLDKGELDKIIERSEQAYAEPAVKTSAPIPGQEYFSPRENRPRFEGPNYADTDHSYHPEHDKHHGHQPYKKRKKESFLGDLFDF